MRNRPNTRIDKANQIITKNRFQKTIAFLNSYALLFAPAVFFFALGATALIAPTFLIGVIAGVFVFFGLAFSFLAWKFIELRTKLEAATKRLQSRFIIQGVQVQGFVDESQLIEQKKIILH